MEKRYHDIIVTDFIGIRIPVNPFVVYLLAVTIDNHFLLVTEKASVRNVCSNNFVTFANTDFRM